jgi:reverse gyrase
MERRTFLKLSTVGVGCTTALSLAPLLPSGAIGKETKVEASRKVLADGSIRSVLQNNALEETLEEKIAALKDKWGMGLTLTPLQRSFVSRCMSCKNVTENTWPRGAGKTTALLEVAILKAGEKKRDILWVSPNNNMLKQAIYNKLIPTPKGILPTIFFSNGSTIHAHSFHSSLRLKCHSFDTICIDEYDIVNTTCQRDITSFNQLHLFGNPEYKETDRKMNYKRTETQLYMIGEKLRDKYGRPL